MSVDVVSSPSAVPTSVEARHIYPQQLSNHQSVEHFPPAHLDDQEFESEGRLIQRKNLRVSFAESDRNPHDNYDPWKDIYLKGDFDRQQSVRSWKKSDRKSHDYDDDHDYIDEKIDKDENEYYYEDDEDISPYHRRPYNSDKKHRQKKPTKIRPNRNKTKSGMGYYDYEDPLKNEGPPRKDLAAMAGGGMLKNPDYNPTLTRRVMDVISPYSGGIVKIAAIIAVPVLLAAGYWLFVVNGPTPVVKARIDDADFDGQDESNDVTGIRHMIGALYRSVKADFDAFMTQNKN